MFGRSLTFAPCETPLRLSFKNKRGGGNERHAGLPPAVSDPFIVARLARLWLRRCAKASSAGDFDGAGRNSILEPFQLAIARIGKLQILAHAQIGDDV